MLLLIPLLLTLSVLEVSTKPDYYWRRFYGTVPFDAVVAAHTDQGPIYIGRAAFEKRGMVVGPITECSKNVTVTTWSIFNKKTVHSVDKLAEILCSPRPHTPFKWVRATTDTLSKQKGLVEGGYESVGMNRNTIANGVLYIGRFKDNKKRVKIGKVLGFNENRRRKYNRLYYADGQNEIFRNSFEVLIYEDRNEPSDKMCPSYPRNIWPQDYYWRKFDGEIPYDAVSVTGQNDTFIGRAPFERRGLLVGPLDRASRKVAVISHSDVSKETVHYLDQFAEILCAPLSSRKGRFPWVAASPESLLSTTGLIEAGFEFSDDQKHDGALYIGRKRGNNNIYGKVVGYFKDDVTRNRFYYDQNRDESSDSDYWVLTYHDPMETLFNEQHHHPTETQSNDHTIKRNVSSQISIKDIE